MLVIFWTTVDIIAVIYSSHLLKIGFVDQLRYRRRKVLITARGPDHNHMELLLRNYSMTEIKTWFQLYLYIKLDLNAMISGVRYSNFVTI